MMVTNTPNTSRAINTPTAISTTAFQLIWENGMRGKVPLPFGPVPDPPPLLPPLVNCMPPPPASANKKPNSHRARECHTSVQARAKILP